jgi:hypothetical protein
VLFSNHNFIGTDEDEPAQVLRLKMAVPPDDDLPEPSPAEEKRIDGDNNGKDNATSGTNPAEGVSSQPIARSRLAQVRPGILQARPEGVSNAGVIGVDAHFSQFGDYLQELVNIVQVQWERILSGGVHPPHSHVAISFRINFKGEISEIIKVEGDAGEYGTGAALSAIREPAPYRAWTKEMVAILGEDQVINFTFYYW